MVFTLTDPRLQQLIAKVETLSEEQRSDIIRKISLFVEVDSKPHDIREVESPDGRVSGHFMPQLRRLDVVHCNFTGVGFEWDGPHYAIVWNVNPKFDAVTVIPTTSEQRTTYANVFNVKQISGLPPGNTTLLVGDTTTVSRKRLDLQTYWHPKRKAVVPVRLPAVWLDRIFQAMAVTFGGEVTFEQFLIHETGVAMPANLPLIHAWRFMPVRCLYDEGSQMLRYRLWNKDQYDQVKMLLPKIQISKFVKVKLVYDLFSPDPTVRGDAEAKYLELYH